MRAGKGSSVAGRFLRYVALLDLAILVVTGLACWFGGWRTIGDYANGLTYVGFAIMAFGGLRYFASGAGGGDPAAGYHSVKLSDQHERAQRAVAESDSAFVFMLKMGVVGLVPIALGQLIKVTIS